MKLFKEYHQMVHDLMQYYNIKTVLVGDRDRQHTIERMKIEYDDFYRRVKKILQKIINFYIRHNINKKNIDKKIKKKFGKIVNICKKNKCEKENFLKIFNKLNLNVF